jgi:hypothetical protein
MGASAGGYAAGDVATGTERTVMKGWTAWGREDLLSRYLPSGALSKIRPQSRFRLHLHASIRYVMAENEVDGVFNPGPHRKLLIFTTRVKRRDGRPVRFADLARLLLKSSTRKLPEPLKYLPRDYVEDPVVFATNLPKQMCSEYARPLTRGNYHRVVEASCLVPLAMGAPLLPKDLIPAPDAEYFSGDERAVFIDGGYALKMPMAAFEEDCRLRNLGRWAAADKTVVFCCDPQGQLWETSSRLRRLNSFPAVARALAEERMLLIYPDHKVEAGFLCLDNPCVMRTFRRGQEQALRLLQSEAVKRFFGA